MTPARRIEPYELAKCTAAILIVVTMITLALTACGSNEPPVTAGVVIDKTHEPAHTETYTEQVYDGQDCKYSSSKKKDCLQN